MFEIVYLLLKKQKMTTTELAQHFEVSKRTILRDIEALMIAGIPLYTTRGRYGGVSILENYTLDKTILSEVEQQQLVLALQTLSTLEPENTQHALAKLRTFFGQSDSHWFEVDFSQWGSSSHQTQKFEVIKTAILANKSILFTYFNSNGKTSPTKVYPIKLIFKSRVWYLQAYHPDKHAYRTYKVNRMSQMKLGTSFESTIQLETPPIDAPYSATTKLVSLHLHFKKNVSFRVWDEFDPHSITKNHDGSLTVRTQLVEDGWLDAFLLSFGSNLKILAPESVRNRLLTTIDCMKKQYR